jgi:alpha-L-fucosidase 2
MRSREPVTRPGSWDDQPAAAWADAFLAGNGRHGALVFGQPRDETVIVTQHRLVRPNGTAGQPPPRLAGRLAGVRALLLAGESAAALDRCCAGWPEHPPQPFHPAFAVRLARPGLGPVTGYRRAVDFADGLVSAEWSGPDGVAWRQACFVSRARDIVVQQVTARGLDLLVRQDAALPGAPAGLGVRPWARAGGSEALLGLDVDYPDVPSAPAGAGPVAGAGPPGGPGYAGATRIIAPGGRCAAEGDAVRVTGAAEVVVLTQVSSRDPGPGPDGASALGGALAEVPADYRALLAEHVRLHRAAYGRVSLDLGASPADRARPVGELLARQAASPGQPLPALLERLFDSGRYLLLAASGLLPPRLTGLWQGDWDAAWGNCLSGNANLNLQLAGAVTADVPAAVHALAGLVAAQLDDWRVNAQRIFGCRGILAPAQADGADGLCRHFAPGWPHQIWTAGADWLLVPLLDYADSTRADSTRADSTRAGATGDAEFLHTAVLPALTELARFYQDFLALRDDGGQVVFAPSYSPENQPRGWTGAALNATMDIAAARHALTEAAWAVDRCEPGDDRPGRWRELAGRLPPYQVNPDQALAEWAWPPGGPPLPDNYDHRHVSHLYPVWPLHEITPVDTPELAAAAVLALRLRGAENGSAHGWLHQALAAARLHQASLAGARLAALTAQDYFFRSLMSSHYPGRRVYNADAALALPGLLTELLADSIPARPGRLARLVLLPAVPGFLPAGRLHGARTLLPGRLDLTWDLRAGSVAAELAGPVSQPIELACPAAAAGARCTASVRVRSLRPGTWRLDLTAGRPTQITIDWAPGPDLGPAPATAPSPGPGPAPEPELRG